VLLVPDFGINTAEAYGAIDTSPQRNETRSQALARSQIMQWETLASWAQNDFTAVASSMHPSIETNIEALRNVGATFAEMTGSGSVVFGIFDKIPDMTHLARVTGGHVIVTQTALQ
jgi:4-diphosphocytidyl-2-C-methyl-D-erythritol kinase